MKVLRKACNILFNILFYSFLFTLLIVFVLFAAGIRPYITMSGSMEPSIHTGSVCFVDTKADYSEAGVGDVIAFEAAGVGLVTHRVISVSENGLETKGDANEVSDGVSTTLDNFRGITLFSVPYAGYAIKYLQQPAVIAIVLILAFGIGVLSIIDARTNSKSSVQ